MPDGSEVTEHEEKAAVLWSAFRNRLGASEQTELSAETLNLVKRTPNLDRLSVIFSEAEIDKIIAYLPKDKAPGPDGFNGYFFRSCWNIIKQDVYRLCQDF